MDDFCKVLIIDDEIIMRQGIKYMIDWEQEGFKIIGQASNGKDAIEIIEKENPDIIISDILMPQMDGIELSKFIQSNYPQIQLIILSGYSNFEYVKSSFQNGAIDYILKPSLKVDDLLESLKKAAANKTNSTLHTCNNSFHTDNMIKRLLLGFNSNIDYNQLKNIFPKHNFYLFGSNLKKVHNNYEERINLFKEFEDQLSLISNNNTIISTVNLENEIIITIINSDENDIKNIINDCNSISSNIALKFPNSFFVLSKPFTSIEEIKRVYDDNFFPLSQLHFFNKNTNFLSFSNLHNNSSDFKNTKSFNFKKFSELVTSMQISTAFGLLDEFISIALSTKTLTEFELKTLLQNCFYNVISTLENINNNSLELNNLKLDYFNKINDSPYMEDLIETYETLVKDLKEFISKQETTFDSNLITKTVKYVQENYAKPLTLSDVAKSFNLNYYYFSSYFSSHYTENFNEFINKIRIEKACDLLKEDIPISKISTMVGYSDQSYFCKVFKKFTGSTPSRFRKDSLL